MAKILVLEADPFLSKLYTVKLKKKNFEVDTLMSGEKALETIKMTAYDGVLMELIFPYRNGFTILQDLKELQKKKPAIVVATELRQADDLKKAFELGADHCFIKGESQVYDVVDAIQALVENKPLPKDTGVDPKNIPGTSPDKQPMPKAREEEEVKKEDVKKEEVKKEDVKKEEVKKEDVKKEEEKGKENVKKGKGKKEQKKRSL